MHGGIQITIDEAVELTGVPSAQLVTHLELFREPIKGVVRISVKALQRWLYKSERRWRDE